MMIGKLLLRGIPVGLVVAPLSFGFLKLAGEPSVDRAIDLERAMDDAKAKVKLAERVVATRQPALHRSRA